LKDKIGYVVLFLGNLIHTIIAIYMTIYVIVRLNEGLNTPASYIFEITFMLAVVIVSWIAYYRITFRKNKSWLHFYIVPFLVNIWIGYQFVKGVLIVDVDDYSLLFSLSPFLLILFTPILLYIAAYILIRYSNKAN